MYNKTALGKRLHKNTKQMLSRISWHFECSCEPNTNYQASHVFPLKIILKWTILNIARFHDHVLKQKANVLLDHRYYFTKQCDVGCHIVILKRRFKKKKLKKPNRIIHIGLVFIFISMHTIYKFTMTMY